MARSRARSGSDLLHADGHGDRTLGWPELEDLYRANRLERRSAAIATLEETNKTLADRARRSLAGLDAKDEAETLNKILHVSFYAEILDRQAAGQPKSRAVATCISPISRFSGNSPWRPRATFPTPRRRGPAATGR